MNFLGIGDKDGSGAQAAAPAEIKSGDAGQPPPAEVADAPMSAGAKVSTMKPGDYLIHIHIQYAKNLQIDGEDTCDPVIKINSIALEKSSKVKKDIGKESKVSYNEHLFMEFKNLEKEQLEAAQVKFSVENKGYFKSDLVGTFDMALSKIYNMKEHTMQDQLIGLTNPNSKDFSRVTGYICVNINIQGPGDEATQLEMGSEKDIAAKKPLMPSSVKKQYKQLYLRLYRAENLPKMDKAYLYGEGSIDAYALLKYGGKKLKTNVITMKDEKVDWMQEMLIPVEQPIRDDKIIVQIKDQDQLVDELCCSLELSIKSMLKYNTTENPDNSLIKWINLYGAPVGYMGSTCEKMNTDPSEASTWKGRILVEIFVKDIKYPVMKIKPIKNDADFQRVQDMMAPRQFQMFWELGQAVSLPFNDKFNIKLSIGKREWLSNSPVQTGDCYCRWDHRHAEKFEDSYQGLKRFPTVYVYLMYGDVPICFKRESIYDFVDPNMPMKWYEFDIDHAIGKAGSNNHQAGIFSMRLYVRSITDEGEIDPSSIPAYNLPIGQKKMKVWRMRAAIYQCESLPPADSEGTSDPYIEIWQKEKQQIRTATCEDTNNPIYYEVKEFILEFDSKERAPPILLNIFDTDEDFMDTTDDFIGRATVFLKDLQDISNDDRIPYPQWFPVQKHMSDQYNEEAGASILCSFAMMDFQQQYNLEAAEIELDEPLELTPGVPYPMPNLNISEFKCEILVLGLRNLVSTGLLPVRKAYVKFNLKSLLPPAAAKAVENIQTQPKQSGSNPNINTTLQFEVKIPEDPFFCPRMTCDAYDMLYFEGMAQPHLGTFTINIGDVIKELREKDTHQISNLRDILKTMGLVIGQQKEMKSGAAQKRGVTEILTEVMKQVGKEENSQANKDKQIGLQILSHLNAQGIDLPSSSSVKKGSVEALKVGPQDDQNKSGLNLKGMQKEEQSKKITDVLGTNVRKKIQLAFEAQLQMQKEELEKTRLQEQQAISGSKNGFNNVIKPEYKYDERLKLEREFTYPPASLFKEVGFDPKPHAGIKHYRRYFPDELENCKDDKGEKLVESPFLVEEIRRAKTVKAGGLLAGLFGGGGDDNGGDMAMQEVGQFKGLVRCYSEELKQKRKADLNRATADVRAYLKQIYDFECAPKRFEFDFQRLNMEKIEDDIDSLDKALKELKTLITEAGLDKLKIFQQLSTLVYDQQLARKLNETTKCKVRVYILEGFNFAQRDLFSLSDPYLIVKCGKESFNEQKDYQLDTSEPKFFKAYDFIVDFPGAPLVEIEAYDYDDFFGDDIIGITRIDLDDRYFSQNWQAIDSKPIEYRDLYASSSTITQGVVKCWVEINQKDSKIANLEPINIAPQPVEDFEVRIVIWKGENIEARDWEGTSDVFFRCFFDPEEDQETDTHWRCSTGLPSFNYRLKMPIKSLKDQYMLTVQGWDKDIIASNDLIGECQLDLTPIIEDAVVTHRQHFMNKVYWEEWMKQQCLDNGNAAANDLVWEEKDRFWLPIRRFVEKDGVFVEAGQVQMSIAIIPKDICDKKPQGVGRQEPNSDPFCPEPEGRIKMSVNPFEMIGQFLTPELKAKIICFFLAGACGFLCVMMAPMIMSNIVTKIIIG